jgi:hypothetical protein
LSHVQRWSEVMFWVSMYHIFSKFYDFFENLEGPGTPKPWCGSTPVR